MYKDKTIEALRKKENISPNNIRRISRLSVPQESDIRLQ
jgi:hypothetical protein